MKVCLKVDLTKYHSDLVAGVEGETVGAVGLWSRGSDRFRRCSLPSTTLDVLSDLEILDQQHLRKLQSEKLNILKR